MYSFSARVSYFNFPGWFKVPTFEVPIVMFSFGSLICVACHLFLRTVASVDLLVTMALIRAILSSSEGFWPVSKTYKGANHISMLDTTLVELYAVVFVWSIPGMRMAFPGASCGALTQDMRHKPVIWLIEVLWLLRKLDLIFKSLDQVQRHHYHIFAFSTSWATSTPKSASHFLYHCEIRR